MTDPVQPRPEPVIEAAKLAGNVAGVVNGLAGIFAAIGAVTAWPWAFATTAALGAVGAGLAKYMPYLTALGARAQVTPQSDPRTATGERLVPLAEAPSVSASMGGSPALTCDISATSQSTRNKNYKGRPVPASSHVRRPRAVSVSYTSRQVASAYSYPLNSYSGKGATVGIVELGGGFGTGDLRSYFGDLGLPVPNVVAVTVDGGKNTSDGPDGADGEVLLDIEVAAAIAPGAAFRVYFAPNTDAGFLAAIKQACAECDIVSISWGGPENAWDTGTMKSFDAAFAAARANNVKVFVAAGDSGSQDSGGDGKNHVDFPASSPSVIGCGGTRLTVNPDGSRKAETVWDDSDTSSATGGGESAVFPGRDVPDVAGNADPATGYDVQVDGGSYVIGGTSAVAPLYAGLAALLHEATGGGAYDFLNTIVSNPTVCFDVTSGDNGGFRAGPGRDETTGFGVVDGARLLAVLEAVAPVPAPPTPAPSPAPTVPPQDVIDLFGRILTRKGSPKEDVRAANEGLTWIGSLTSAS